MQNRLRNKSILIIDDDAGMLRSLEKVLSSEGCKVTCAAFVEDALKFLIRRTTATDLVITDLWMPGITGLAGIYSIRRLFPDLPVIVLTAFGSPDIQAACQHQGVAAVLEKPLDTIRLLAAIEESFATNSTGPANCELA